MIYKRLTLSLLTVGLLSCSTQNQYIIKLNTKANATQKALIQQSVGISSLVLPNYLLKYPIAKRVGENQIEYLDNHIWADRLDDALKRELINYLQYHSNTREVLNYPWGVLPDVTIDLSINEFIATNEKILLSTTLKIYYRQQDKTVIYNFNREKHFSGKDEDIAQAMSLTFKELSYKIANIVAKR